MGFCDPATVNIILLYNPLQFYLFLFIMNCVFPPGTFFCGDHVACGVIHWAGLAEKSEPSLPPTWMYERFWSLMFCNITEVVMTSLLHPQVIFQTKPCPPLASSHGSRGSSAMPTTPVFSTLPAESLQVLCPTTTTQCEFPQGLYFCLETFKKCSSLLFRCV